MMKKWISRILLAVVATVLAGCTGTTQNKNGNDSKKT